MAEHTPIPYTFDQDGDSIMIRGADKIGLAEMLNFQNALIDAAFIVRACNAHAALVEALGDLVKFCEDHAPGWKPEFSDPARPPIIEP